VKARLLLDQIYSRCVNHRSSLCAAQYMAAYDSTQDLFVDVKLDSL
jgi:hypothetical protein